MKKKGTSLKKLESKGEEIANFVSHTVRKFDTCKIKKHTLNIGNA